jgi:hypothetical protein
MACPRAQVAKNSTTPTMARAGLRTASSEPAAPHNDDAIASRRVQLLLPVGMSEGGSWHTQKRMNHSQLASLHVWKST